MEQTSEIAGVAGGEPRRTVAIEGHEPLSPEGDITTLKSPTGPERRGSLVRALTRGANAARATDSATAPDDRPPTKPLDPNHSKAARLLIGWVPDDAACASLAGPMVAPPYPDDVRERVRRAHQVVRDRPPIDRTVPVVSDVPDSLTAYISELATKPFFQPFRAERWSVRMANLRRVQVVQWQIHTAHAEERTDSATAADVLSLARVALPLSRAKELTCNAWSPDGRTLMVTCRNPMLRPLALQHPALPTPVCVTLEDAIEPVTGLELKRVSFHLLIDNSQVQVVRWRGAYFLRDGNHRAFGLLSRGITTIPVLYREYADHEDPGLPKVGIFDPAVYLGERPPVLADFIDDGVSAPIDVRATQKTFLFQVIENDLPLL